MHTITKLFFMKQGLVKHTGENKQQTENLTGTPLTSKRATALFHFSSNQGSLILVYQCTSRERGFLGAFFITARGHVKNVVG
jgi:hypothetical protein